MAQQAQQQQQPQQAPQPQQSWANPGPWGLFAIAVLTASVGSFNAALLPPTAGPLLIGILLSCFLPQFVGGLIHFQRGELLIGTVNALFGTVATLGGAITIWQLTTVPKPGLITPELMSIFWITLFVAMQVIAVGFGRMSWLIMLAISEVGLSFLFIGLGMFVIGGWLLIIFSVFAMYLAAAILWAETFQRPVLPLGGPAFR
jgi:succinate-acetate transporter protein